MGTLHTKQALLRDERLEGDRNNQCVRILWTGGWDSTFRVLYATWVEGKRVEPHYIVDTTRSSSSRELEAIAEIKDVLKVHNEAAYERISSLEVTPKSEIPEDLEITKSWTQLKKRMHLGGQYDWLARYAKSKKMTALELCVQRDDRTDGIYAFLKKNTEQTPFGTYRLRQEVSGDGVIFARFEFPVLDYSKNEMRDIAKEHGFIEILEKSWFCHEPINGMPCGMCNPCACTVEEGMDYRLSRDAIFRYRTRRYLKVVRQSLVDSRAFRWVYDLLRYGSKRKV
ncbi:MAG: 7-cyano-7-deazaguanine synthase [Nitrospira sp.]|nr:7-cyano-7-deazaguanine synthase [Nitrospira sp.]